MSHFLRANCITLSSYGTNTNTSFVHSFEPEMGVWAPCHCNCLPLQLLSATSQPRQRFSNVSNASGDIHYGRRELVFKGMRAFRPWERENARNSEEGDPASLLVSRDGGDTAERIVDINRLQYLFASRRLFFVSMVFSYWASPLRHLPACALGDPSLTVEEVTPPVYSSGKLFSSEERIVEVFERNTYSVVNIFDVTLRPQLNMTGAVEVPEGNGSGVVWDRQGHIVTNYHVIGNALSRNPGRGQVVGRVNILESDGVQKNFEGTLVGADRTKDVAVLKVDAPMGILQPIKVGQSSKLKVGQRCLAIGNPFGFDHTLTVGVLSGLNREIFSQTGVTISGGIQTDAAINPGNSKPSTLYFGCHGCRIFITLFTSPLLPFKSISKDLSLLSFNLSESGGPLLDSKGNLIGINTAIFTQTGTSAGVGFAIPADTVLKIVPQLILSGKVLRPGLNVQIAPEAIANQLNVRNGALVLSVLENSTAAKSGLISTRRGFAGTIILGDVIIGIGNSPIKNAAELSKVLDDYNVGDKVVLKVQRSTGVVEIPVTLEESTI